MLIRATLEASNDDTKLQEVDVNLSHGEKARGVEHVQPYGLSARPVAPTGKDRAEALILPVAGSRSHPIAIAVTDRRYRPKGMKRGEVKLHDNQDQSVYLSDDGIEIATAKKITLKVGASTIVMDASGITIKGAAIKFEQS